jgi:hypothetical protein
MADVDRFPEEVVPMSQPLCTVVVLSLLVPAALPVHAQTIRVPADQPTIQAGIDAASPGGIVLVAPGIYTGSDNKNLDFGGKEITARSEAGRGATVIDCQRDGRGFWFHGGETGAATVEGFTIRNGDVEPSGGDGGGMLIEDSSPTIRQCAFEGNRASTGGGAYCYLSSSLFVGCVFYGNLGQVGGGLSCRESSPTLRECLLEENDNLFGMGGGLSCYGCPLIMLEDCVIRRNRAGTQGTSAGGITCGESSLSLSRCSIEENSANRGGGLVAERSTLVLEDCSITDNVAAFDHGLGSGIGGGLRIWQSSTTLTECTFEGNEGQFGGPSPVGVGGAISSRDGTLLVADCRFVANEVSAFIGFPAEGGGGAIASEGTELEIRGSTFFRNSAALGGAVHYVDGTVEIGSCTFVENEAAEGSGLYLGGYSAAVATVDRTIIAFGAAGAAVYCQPQSRATLSCSDVFGNQGGDWTGCLAGQMGANGNFSANPLLCDQENGDLTLAGNSPCLPGNHPNGVPCGLVGAHGEGCPPVAVSGISWGAIKSRYR